MNKDFFLQENDGRTYFGTRIKDKTSVGNILDTLFDNDTLSTIDYHATRTLSNGYTVKYYLTHFKELYSQDFWSIAIYFPEEVAEHLKKIVKACDWRTAYTKESIKSVFKKYPHICNDVILEENYSVSWIEDYREISKIVHGKELSDYTERTVVEELVNEAIAIMKELLSFRIDTNGLVRRSQEIKQHTELPDWLRMGINGVIRVGARALSSYIGTTFDTNFDIGNIDVGNVDTGDVDFGSFDAGDFSIGDFDGGDFDGGDGFNVNFEGKNTLPPNANSDGYIPDGSISLTRTISDITDTFKHYKKDGHDYVLYSGHYYRIDGSGTVTIGGIKYDKI